MTNNEGFVLYLLVTIGLASLCGALADVRDRRMGLWFAVGLWLPGVTIMALMWLPQGRGTQATPEPLPSQRMHFAAVRS